MQSLPDFRCLCSPGALPGKRPALSPRRPLPHSAPRRRTAQCGGRLAQVTARPPARAVPAAEAGPSPCCGQRGRSPAAPRNGQGSDLGDGTAPGDPEADPKLEGRGAQGRGLRGPRRALQSRRAARGRVPREARGCSPGRGLRKDRSGFREGTWARGRGHHGTLRLGELRLESPDRWPSLCLLPHPSPVPRAPASQGSQGPAVTPRLPASVTGAGAAQGTQAPPSLRPVRGPARPCTGRL